MLYEDNEDGKNNVGHGVYLFRGDNGRFGIISVHTHQYRHAQFGSAAEAASIFMKEGYDSYQLAHLPDDDQILLYRPGGIKDYVGVGPNTSDR